MHKLLRMFLVSSHCRVHLIVNLALLSSACRKRAVLNIRLCSMGWAFLPMVQLCRRRLWNGSHPLRWCTCVVGNWRVMLTWPCCLRMVAITDVTSKALTSKCLRLKCSGESNVSNRKRFCACILMYLLFCKKDVIKVRIFLAKNQGHLKTDCFPEYVRRVSSGFHYALEFCLVNLELPYNY